MGKGNNEEFVFQSKFWVEIRVSVAKSVSFIVSAKECVDNKNYVSGAICAYYALFHFGLFLMWLFPELIETKLKEDLVKRRDKGEDLPASDIPTHKQIKKFLKAISDKLGVAQLVWNFDRAQDLRNFVNYEPRVYYDGKQPYVGRCEHNPANVCRVVQDCPDIFRNVIGTVWALDDTNMKKSLICGALTDSINLLEDSQFPFVNWFPDSVLNRAVEVIGSYIEYCKC